jgi:hypothetical protein
MSSLITFALLAANPVGGLTVAIPVALLKLDFSPVPTVAVGVPLAYLQVLVVDACWSWLEKLGWWRRLIERSRGRWAERLVSARGAFWVTFVSTPILGPWLVMALMRWAGVGQRRVAFAILSSLTVASSVIAALCVFVPSLLEGGGPALAEPRAAAAALGR